MARMPPPRAEARAALAPRLPPAVAPAAAPPASRRERLRPPAASSGGAAVPGVVPVVAGGRRGLPPPGFPRRGGARRGLAPRGKRGGSASMASEGGGPGWSREKSCSARGKSAKKAKCSRCARVTATRFNFRAPQRRNEWLKAGLWRRPLRRRQRQCPRPTTRADGGVGSTQAKASGQSSTPYVQHGH